MERHWALALVAFANVAAGFALFAAGSTTLAGVVTAAGADGLVIPELVESRSAIGAAPGTPSGVTTDVE